MSFSFLRMQEDGRMASVTPSRLFKTREEAKKAAPLILSGKRNDSRIVLVEIQEIVVATVGCQFEKWTGK